jgi:3-oxoacyl-[acyl-carrier-protein] synthase-1
MAFDVIGAGMVTAVGFDAPASCAALRARLDGFVVSQFMFDDALIQAAEVPLPSAPRGSEKLLQMAALVLKECVAQLPQGMAQDTALVLCLPEQTRAGRIHVDQELEWSLKQACDSPRLRPAKLICDGSLAGIRGLEHAQELFATGAIKYAIVLGVDSYLHVETLGAYHAKGRLMTDKNSDGFIPGEAAGGVVLSRPQQSPDAFRCFGIGWGKEEAVLGSDKPLRGDGLTQAFKAALAQAGFGFEQLDYRMTDISGEQYHFKEAALALTRSMRVRKAAFDLWHTADSIGRVGAASVPITLGAAWMAARKDYAPGPGVICHFADDAGERAALVLRAHGKASNPAF